MVDIGNALAQTELTIVNNRIVLYQQAATSS